MLKKCDIKKCEWYMGDDFKTRPYLNGKCYHSEGVKSMFCPLNKQITPKTLKNKQGCSFKKIENVVFVMRSPV